MEKPELYDHLLDLTPIASSESEPNNSSLPKLLSTVQVRDKNSSRMKLQLKSQSWTAKELTLFTQLDLQAVEMTERARVEPREEDTETEDVGKVNISTSTSNSLERSNQSGSMSNPTGRFLMTVFTLIRYYLSGFWFLPKTWSPLFLSSSSSRGASRRMGNRSSPSGNLILPLGIRGDGGVRTSVLIRDPDDGDDEEGGDSQDEVLDQVEDRGGKGKGKAIETSPSKIKRKTSSLSRSISRVDDDEEVVGDPLLAAAGARSPRKDRKPIIVQSDETLMPGNYSHEEEEEEEYDDEELSEEEEFRERSLFAKSLAKVWSDWSRNLVQDLEELLTRKVSETQNDEESEQKRVILTSKELSGIGLSSSNHVDVRLVRTVAERSFEGSGERIVIKREWWRFL